MAKLTETIDSNAVEKLVSDPIGNRQILDRLSIEEMYFVSRFFKIYL